MENAEEIFHFLEEFSKRKPKSIPQELNEYLVYVARTGDPVFQWTFVKSLIKEKLLNVITDFYETTPGIDIPSYPNVDPFDYDIMKNSLLERLDTFTSAPFTVQRICELLTCPRKQYNRIDKFMRAIEKNILVVSTREPGIQRHAEPENGEPIEPIVNGSDNNSEYNVDVEMEDISWKENNHQQQSREPQPSSSDDHNTANDIEARLEDKQDALMDSPDKIAGHYESVAPPELNVDQREQSQAKQNEESLISSDKNTVDETNTQNKKPPLDNEIVTELPPEESKVEPEITSSPPMFVIPEIKIDDAEMTEQKLKEQSSLPSDKNDSTNKEVALEKGEPLDKDEKLEKSELPIEKDSLIQTKDAPDSEFIVDENSSDSNTKEETEAKLTPELSSFSEESSSSSDNVDGSSNSPKLDSDSNVEESQEESNQSISSPKESIIKPEEVPNVISGSNIKNEEENSKNMSIESDNYSISDMNSEILQKSNTEIKTDDTLKTDSGVNKDVAEIEKSEDEKNGSTETPSCEIVS